MTAANPTFLHDTFTDTNGKALASHTGELGATWTNTSNITIQNNQAVASTNNNFSVIASGVSSSPNYTITAVFNYWSTVGGYNGLWVRCTGGFGFALLYNGSFSIYDNLSGTIGNTLTVSLSSGSQYNFILSVNGGSASVGATLTAYVQRVSDYNWLTSSGTWQSAQVACINATGNTTNQVLTAASAAMCLSTSDGSSSGMACTEIYDGFPATPLTSGVASSGGDTATTAALSCTAAGGGVSPYTYQWYRSTTNGFTPGSGNIISGATSLTLNDTGLLPSTTYYYICVVTDVEPVTANSNQVSVTTPSGAIVVGTAAWGSATTTTINLTCTASGGGQFSLSYQWQRSADATTWTNVSGQTNATSMTDTPAITTLPYAYRLAVTDGVNTAYSNIVLAALMQPTIAIGWIGDSIWGSISGNATATVPDTALAKLQRMYGPRNVISVNQALSGATMASWVPSASLYITAKAAFIAAGVQYVMYMLGTNGGADSVSMTATLTDLVSSGFTVILNYPGTFFPGGESGLAAVASLMNSQVNGTTILLGDTEFPAWAANNRADFSAGYVHPTAAGQEDLAVLDAMAISRVIDLPNAIAAAVWSYNGPEGRTLTG
jgi:hypothetical protein